MIRLERSYDYDLVAQIMTRPELYRWIREDGYPDPEFFYPNTAAANHFLLAYDGKELLGVIVTHPIYARTWEVHHALLPAAWGARAHRIGIEFERWLWTNTKAETAVGFTPANNALGLRFARKHGMQQCGRIPRAVLKGGEFVDLVVFSKSRPSSTSISQPS